MPTTSDVKSCRCGCGSLTYRLFAPGHAERYDMDCLRDNVSQTRKVLARCFRG